MSTSVEVAADADDGVENLVVSDPVIGEWTDSHTNTWADSVQLTTRSVGGRIELGRSSAAAQLPLASARRQHISCQSLQAHDYDRGDS